MNLETKRKFIISVTNDLKEDLLTKVQNTPTKWGGLDLREWIIETLKRNSSLIKKTLGIEQINNKKVILEKRNGLITITQKPQNIKIILTDYDIIQAGINKITTELGEGDEI